MTTPTTQIPPFATFNATPAPAPDAVEQRYAALLGKLDQVGSADELIELVAEWDALKRETETWTNLVELRFSQDTSNPEAQAERERCDQLSTAWRLHDLTLQRALLDTAHRPALEQRMGGYVFKRWECDVAAFAPQIADDVVQEQALCAAYQALTGGAKIELNGESLTLSQLRKYEVSPERAVRRQAVEARWDWMSAHGAELDKLYDDLVKLRHNMATKLGYEHYIQLAYKLRQRTDYGPDEIARWREEVRRHVVPAAQEIQRQRAQRLGLDSLKVWDEGIYDDQPNPAPQGDDAWMVGQARQMFDEMDGELGEFFRLMADQGYMDLESRVGKAGGGFCTAFSQTGMPFIFANFNGTAGDTSVFTHEMGHAFQCWSSRHAPLHNLVWPTNDAAEIHSMSLEFLTWPWMELFFGEQADRFRKMHLEDDLLFLPYGVAVDHFQHEVFANPSATPAERHAMWSAIEQIYTPWRDWDSIEYGKMGGRWQGQLHIYVAPFYYVDYTLAGACAMQLWLRANEDRAAAMDAYKALCKRGGTAPFGELVRGAGLRLPYEQGALEAVIAQARSFLAG
jgi:M3 family oligoendopeptidase